MTVSIALDVMEDEYRIQALERQHLKIVVNNRYIACEDMNLIWDMKEVQSSRKHGVLDMPST